MNPILRTITVPFQVGLAIGFFVGVVAVFGGRIFELDLNDRQEAIVLISFTACFGIFGLADSIYRLVWWLRHRE